MSYRAALIALIASLLYMVAWLHAAGMEIRVVVLYLFFTAVAYIGMARFAAELGLPYGDIAYHSITWTPLHIMGGQTVTASTLTCQGYLWAMFGKTRGFPGTANRANVEIDHPIAGRAGASIWRNRARRGSRRDICNTPRHIHGLFLRRLQPQSRVESANWTTALLRRIRNLDPQPRGTRCRAHVIHGIWRLDHSRTHLFEIPLRTPAPPSRSPHATGHLYGAENRIFGISHLDLQSDHPKNRWRAPLQERNSHSSSAC